MLKTLLPINDFGHPMRYFFAGFFYVVIAVIASLIFFPNHASIATLFLVTIGATPLMYKLMLKEESIAEGERFFKQYGDLFQAMLHLFFGQVAAFLLLYFAIGSTHASAIFGLQNPVFDFIGMHAAYPSLANLLIAQFKILFLCVVLSFLYGAGAIFMMSFAAATLALGIIQLALMSGIGMFAFFIFIILQVAAFLSGGFASGVLGVAVSRFHLTTRKAKNMLTDVTILLVLSILLIIASAIVEMITYPFFY